jgi:hypothetical protein
VQWDYFTASSIPSGFASTKREASWGTPPFEAGFYRYLNVNSPYVDFLKAHVREIIEMMPADGFFFDIVQPIPSTDRYTQAKMRLLALIRQMPTIAPRLRSHPWATSCMR